MSSEIETGFGTGLRSMLERKNGGGEPDVEPVAVPSPAEEPFAVEPAPAPVDLHREL